MVAYDDIALGGRELELVGELRCPRRVCILRGGVSAGLWTAGLGRTHVGSTGQRNGGRSDDGHDPRLLVGRRLLQVGHGRRLGGFC